VTCKFTLKTVEKIENLGLLKVKKTTKRMTSTAIEFSVAEVSAHNTEKDCWVIIHDKAYNVSNFLNEHPGGFDLLVDHAGKDATANFDLVGHTDAAKKVLARLFVGNVKRDDQAKSSSLQSSVTSSLPKARAQAEKAESASLSTLIAAGLALGAISIGAREKYPRLSTLAAAAVAVVGIMAVQ